MNRLFSAIVLTFLLFSLGCGVRAQNSKKPSEQDCYKLAAEYSAANRGVSVLVMKGDKIVFEDYENGHTMDQAWFLASGTKSFSGVMLAAAIEDKLIAGFDEKVADTITEWKTDKQKSEITLRQLLSLTSGLESGQIGRVPDYRDAIGFSSRFAPGTHFAYGPVPFQIFGEVMRRKLEPKKETVMEYLKRRILDPIGLKVFFWRMSGGNPMLPQGASLTAREWVKFGLFLKNGGKWNGKQLVAKKLLAELTVGSQANPAYGITFWLNHAGKNPMGMPTEMRVETDNGKEVEDLYMAAGAGNQRLYIIPSKDLVVVRQANFGEYDDREFLGRLLFGRTK
ncbi:MAG: serine hydrolase [Acidobacteria bacterium]|nr:serine hydrolase [Acidobacteriota bacterium]